MADYFKLRFGVKAEILQVLTSLPTFIGWIAVQLVALAGLFEVLFGWPATPTIIGLGLFALVYTLLGGMWSVGLTDSLQALLLILGLLLLGWHVWQDLASTTGGCLGLESDNPLQTHLDSDRTHDGVRAMVGMVEHCHARKHSQPRFDAAGVCVTIWIHRTKSLLYCWWRLYPLGLCADPCWTVVPDPVSESGNPVGRYPDGTALS